MDKAYNISEIRFENDFLIITINNEILKFKLTNVSEKIAKASEIERNDFKITPSGYGIHWRLIDEDLSINGLLKVAKSGLMIEHHI